jgi:hypothetical protein
MLYDELKDNLTSVKLRTISFVFLPERRFNFWNFIQLRNVIEYPNNCFKMTGLKKLFLSCLKFETVNMCTVKFTR